MARPIACLFYRGPSEIDGKEIVAIATTGTSNRKTGDMIQTWILRSDTKPTRAVATGKDVSICGDCVHRGDPRSGRPRTCYVVLAQAPNGVWDKFRRRGYPKMPLGEFVAQRGNQPLRLGSYGDPTAVPLEVWRDAISRASSRTGYTHQWRKCDQRWKEFVMASCDSPSQAIEAAKRGWRTFLVRPFEDPVSETAGPQGHIECLAESRGRTCEDCGLCFGAHQTAPSIWIRAHGTAKRFVSA